MKKTILLLFVSTSFLAVGCDLALYDPDSTIAADLARDLTLEAETDISGWDEYDDDRLIVPDGFFPDQLGATTGYLVYEDNSDVRVWRVDDRGVFGPTSIFVPSSPDAGWEAWVVPVDPVLNQEFLALNPGAEALRPAFLFTVWGDGSQPRLGVFLFDPETDEFGGGELDTTPILTDRGFPNTEIVSYQVITVGPASEFSNGAFASVTVTGLQILFRDISVPEIREISVVSTPFELIDWIVNGDLVDLDLGIQPVPQTRFNQIPPRSDGQNPDGAVRFGSVFAANASIMSFPDGGYTGAPRRAFRWPTNLGGIAPVETDAGFLASNLSFQGVARSGRTGTITEVRNLSATPQILTRNLGSLWYAGQYPAGPGSIIADPEVLARATLQDVYTAVGVNRSFGDVVMSIQVFSDR